MKEILDQFKYNKIHNKLDIHHNQLNLSLWEIQWLNKIMQYMDNR